MWGSILEFYLPCSRSLLLLWELDSKQHSSSKKKKKKKEKERKKKERKRKKRKKRKKEKKKKERKKPLISFRIDIIIISNIE